MTTTTASQAQNGQPHSDDALKAAGEENPHQDQPTSENEEVPITNGHATNDESPERPSKRRRISEATQNTPPRKKVESPPWKRVVADGPSFFTQDGKRKSGRTNQVPLELQPPSNKRQTRGTVQRTASATRSKFAGANLNKASANAKSAQDTPNGYSLRRPHSSGKGSSEQAPKAQTKVESSPRHTRRRSTLNRTSPTPTTSHTRRTITKLTRYGKNSDVRQPSRRSMRVSEAMLDGPSDDPHTPEPENELLAPLNGKATTPRFRFKIKPTKLPTVHHEQVPQRPKLYSSFRDFVENAHNVPIEGGGYMEVDDASRYTDESAAKDAQFLVRIEDALEPGGILGSGVSSIYTPNISEEPPRQYAHLDHMSSAATEFRRLMIVEQNKHRKNAKRLAENCRDEWLRKQPKTAEQLIAEQLGASEARYRQLVKTLKGTWENVKAEINRQRLLEWEAQEQIRVRKALNKVVDISAQKLEARMLQRESSAAEDEEEDDDDGEDGDDEDDDDMSGSEKFSSAEEDSNMSASQSDADSDVAMGNEAEDAVLTVDELRQKYSELPKATSDTAGFEKDSDMNMNLSDRHEAKQDESDESIDMDSETDTDQERGTDNDEMSEEDEPALESTLAGFFKPSELAVLVNGHNAPERNLSDEDYELDEEDEVSLIPDASHVEITEVESDSDNDTSYVPREKPELEEEVEDDEIEEEVSEETINVESGSVDQSSHPTPRTIETKPSSVDSASSIDLKQDTPEGRASSTPQPQHQLKTPVPFLLRGTLREYQHYGLDWLANLYANRTNGILADEMGLGKTIQTIALLAHLACKHEVWGPHLVIVPTSVMLNWEMEFKKWCPGFKILTYYGNIEERKRKRTGWSVEDSFNVCITSYQLVIKDKAVFRPKKWHYMILDEAHNIKNFRSERWQTLLTFNTRARLLLTGTPLQNNLTELWSLVYFLIPPDAETDSVGEFADLQEFKNMFGKSQDQILEDGVQTMDENARVNISKLHTVLRPYLLRRMKADVEKQMPAKYEHVEMCRLSRRQRELYDGFLARSDTRGTLASGNYLSIINCLMQLRKVCNHPDLFQERAIVSSLVQRKSVIADYEIKDFLVRRQLLQIEPMKIVSLDFLNLIPTKYECRSSIVQERTAMLTASRVLTDMRDIQRFRAQSTDTMLDLSTVNSNLTYLEGASRWSRFEELQHIVYLNALRRQQRPIYGRNVIRLLDLGLDHLSHGHPSHTLDRAISRVGTLPQALIEMVPTLQQRSVELHPYIQRFTCVTPPIIARDSIPTFLSRRGVSFFQTTNSDLTERKTRRIGHDENLTADPFHEARMRLSVQFPDKRLLQFDCGKLQTLDQLLRRLQSIGSRALIFTQMTKVLDILEQFLNIHGHKYLRLDGSTKIEQRQLLTDRFNNDPRILAFILSSRSGGLGINLTGADTVIFYDLDWNPAMDKQCQDRCHRIGQTRDVHVYRLISEGTIEGNILRKARQKQMLDDVVIQEGEFTTEWFEKRKAAAAAAETTEAAIPGASSTDVWEGDRVANEAMDRVLGATGGESNEEGGIRLLQQAEDREDVVAAEGARREGLADAADFEDTKISHASSAAVAGGLGPAKGLAADAPTDVVDETITAAKGIPDSCDNDDDDDKVEPNAWGEAIGSADDFMLRTMREMLKDVPLEMPKNLKKGKNGRDRLKSRRVR